jgi:hypothetical protein
MRRRTRTRYYTIDAETEEEFIKEYENMKKSRLSELNFKQKQKEYIPENQYNEQDEDCPSPKKSKNVLNLVNSDSDEDYLGLGAKSGLDEDEDCLGQIYEDDEILKGDESLIKNVNQNNEEKGLEMLCYYLKNSVKEMSDGKGGECIFINNKNKNVVNALSGNAIYDLNIRDLVDNILTENDNEYTKTNEGNNNSLKDYIFQNIESDSNLKIMIMSNNESTKNSFIETFFGIKKNKCSQKTFESNEIVNETDDNDDNDFDNPFVIRKKQIKLFNKNITLQIFDTSDEYHKSPLAYMYYKPVSAFFIFIEGSKNNSKKYLDFILEKLNKYIINKTCVIFGINMLFKEDCTIEGTNLREYASEKNIMYVPIKLNNFNMKNELIVNLFKLILIKGIDNKTSRESLRKGSKERKNAPFQNIQNKLTGKIKDSSQKKEKYDLTKMNIESSLGYKKKYRIKHINAFDLEDSNDLFSTENKRKLSADI